MTIIRKKFDPDERPDISPETAARLDAMTDDDIDYSDIPEFDNDFWDNAEVVFPEDPGKSQITARFDSDMLNWFKAKGRGYQARMNAVLRSYYEAHKSD